MNDFSEKYKRFNAADYLNDLDDVAHYLSAAVEDSADDADALPQALRTVSRSRHLGELARRIGTPPDALAAELGSESALTISTVLKVTSALGLRLELHRPE